METVRVPVKQEFMRSFQRYEPTVLDHSAIILAKNCFRRYFYRIVLGRVPRESFPFFTFGSCYHKFREVLELAYLDAPKSEQDAPDSQLVMFQKAINAAMELWAKKRATDPPVGSKWDFLTKARLIESCAVAFKHWQGEKRKKQIVVLAVEQNFILPFPDGEYTGGKADQIVLWNGKPWGRDFKTTSKEKKYYERTVDPNDQFTRYTWGVEKLSGQPVSGIIVEALYNAKSVKAGQKGPEIWTLLATRSLDQVQQWERESVTFNKILNVIRNDDQWPMEESNCSFCPYHSVCSRPTERAQMAKLESEFNVEPWNFLERMDDE